MKALDIIAIILLVIGGLNWGILGLTALAGGMGTNVVWMIFGMWPWLVNIIYILVGLSAIYVGWMAMMMKKGGNNM